MKRKGKAAEETLRDHYDFHKLELVALGPGWFAAPEKKKIFGSSIRRDYYTWRLAPARPIFSSINIDRELLADFFMTFARAEYALKKAGYLKGDRQGRPIIQWDDFAESIANSILNAKEPEVQKAIEYLANNPPARQVVRNGSLTWQARKAPNAHKDAVFLIRSITTVRNNLFHGGKRIEGRVSERDRQLLLSCLNLLSYAISLDPEVLGFFEELPMKRGAA
jgi:hypothetical protein